MRIIAIFVLVFTLLCVGCTGDKSDYDTGIAAYERGHYAVALSNFESRVMKDEDDFVAQFCLGYMYKQGKGVRANNEKAIEYYEKSAEQDYAPAMNNLAIMYLQRARDARIRLTDGWDTSKMEEIRSNFDKCNKWFGKAILEEDNPVAQYNFAQAHYVEAVTLEVFAEGKDEILESHLKRPQEDQDQEWIEFWMSTPDRAEEEYKQAVIWFTEAAENDYPEAQYELANRYYYGEGVDENLTETEKWKKSVEWYTEAQDYAPAQNALAKMYAEGKGVEKNTTKAVELYKKAVELYKKVEKKEYADAQFNLAEMYSRGDGIDENLTETEKWKEVVRLYTKAADEGHAAAQNNLAKVYTEGISITEGKSIFKNPEKAARLLFRAAQQGNPVAQTNIGLKFETGLYNSETKRYEVPQDDEEAYYWYSLALRDRIKLDELAATENYADKVDKWREGIGNKLEEDKKNETQDRVDKWKKKASIYRSGTGFYISEHYILTNEHVVQSADEFRTPYRRVELIAVDKDVDLALLYDERGNTNTATFRNDPVYMEERIVSFGYPKSHLLSYEGNRTEGTVSGRSGMLNMPHPDNYFQHTAPIQGGNSGGPVFDLMGNVVGVTKYGMISTVPIARIIEISPPQNVNFAIKFDVVKEFLRKNGFEEDLGSSIKKEKNYKVYYASTENLSNAPNSKGAGVYEKAKKFTVPVLCFKNKEPEPVLFHEISIEELVKTPKDTPNSDED